MVLLDGVIYSVSVTPALQLHERSLLQQPMQHLNQSLLQFVNITYPLPIAAALFSRPCGQKDSELCY